MQKKTENLLYSGGGLVAAFVILVLANLVLGAARGRIDLTQGKLFTLSEGTRAVLAKLESPVKIRLYFTQGDAGVPLPIKAYGRRVEDLLAEFRQAGRGKVLVEKLDPQPDSDAEDSATLEGIEAQVTSTGEKFYLGAAVSYLDQKLALPALTPDREPLLEYDLTRAIARLGSLLMPFAGVFTGKPVEGLSETVLMKTSAYSQLVDSFSAMTQGEAAVSGFAPSGTEYPLAVRLSGKFGTAFPEGPPKADDQGDKKAAAAQVSQAAPLKESAAENAVVLVGDSDFINDGAAVQVQEIFGQRIVVPRNGNLAFAQALVDQFAGDPALISLRSRASAARPFTVIRDMEAKAQQAYLGKIKELENNLTQTQEKLNALQKGRGTGAGAILSAEQQVELENFRKKAAETRLVLKEVRRELRADSEALQFWTKVLNIALVPLLVAIAGVALAIWRRRRVPAL